VQIRFRCKSYCVERKIEPTPGLAYCLKYRVKLTWRLHVTGQEDRRLQLSRERLDVGLGLVVTIGNGEIGAESTVLCAPMPRMTPFLPPRGFCEISIMPISLW
jgi:hypothetical protein